MSCLLCGSPSHRPYSRRPSACSPWAQSRALHALALAVGGVGSLRHAEALTRDSPARLERANVLVDLGSSLRRDAQRSEAAAVLCDALDLSDQCGATPLADRARDEMQLAGARPRRRRSTGPAVKLSAIAYQHLLVAYDGTSEGDEAVVAADLLAQRDRSRLTIAVVVELERPVRWITRWPRGTGVWNDVLLDRARADLDRAGRLVHAPAEFTVLFGPPRRALPDGAQEFDCDAIMLPPRPRRRLARLLWRDPTVAIRRRASCAVLQPR